MGNKHELGPVGTNVLFENSKVKVWELVLAPGESSSWHHHTWDYITVGLMDSVIDRELIDGTKDRTTPGLGVFRYADGHEPHRVTNVGDKQHRNLLIEIKEAPE
jgi:hypothetical protein